MTTTKTTSSNTTETKKVNESGVKQPVRVQDIARGSQESLQDYATRRLNELGFKDRGRYKGVRVDIREIPKSR